MLRIRARVYEKAHPISAMLPAAVPLLVPEPAVLMPRLACRLDFPKVGLGVTGGIGKQTKVTARFLGADT